MEKYKIVVFLVNMYLIYIYVNSETEQELSTHALTLSPPSTLQQMLKSGNICYFVPWALNSSFIFQKAYLSKHFLISGCSMTSFYAVSAISNSDVTDTFTIEPWFC